MLARFAFALPGEMKREQSILFLQQFYDQEQKYFFNDTLELAQRKRSLEYPQIPQIRQNRVDIRVAVHRELRLKIER